ncbi:Nucleotidyltransferase domain protein [Tepidimonas sediminis]|uniref:Nucleotidyltransferase domain protein n=1 Tax=Tepidimonas sediminis TaxID=2588941 RepID=A0A554WT68_9BURK|nr:nucleotidyltransferase domain-containing protein [Tepidimonas sediminis]TSE26765.1 Nucleotidyltransferase domain protein [Tepidimonas sediminis]
MSAAALTTPARSDTALDAPTARAVRAFLARIAPRHPLQAAWVYGSRARGDHRPDSDVDVALLLPRQPRRAPVALELADAAFDVLLEHGVRISPLPVWQDEWAQPQRHPNPALLQRIADEGRAVWPLEPP